MICIQNISLLQTSSRCKIIQSFLLIVMYTQIHNRFQQNIQRRDYANNVLVANSGNIYFCPAYLRVIFLEVEDIDIKELTANFYTILLITIYYKGLPQILVQQLKEIKLSVRNVESIILNSSGEDGNCHIANNKQRHYMEYVYRGKLPLLLECDVLLAPFQVIDFNMFLTLHPIIVSKNNQLLQINFNFMDIDNMQTKCTILYRDSNISGSYGLAQSSLQIQFKQARKYGRQKRMYMMEQLPLHFIQSNKNTDSYTYKINGGLMHQARIYSWKFVSYSFKMYRYPINVLVIIFVPLWILSFTNLVIFWSASTDVSGRLQTISGLMIAYAALLPTIRQRIPPSPNITLLQWMIYALSFTIFLSSLQTLIAATDVGYSFLWYRNWRFLLSMIITIITIVISVFLTVIYKCVWQPRYNFVKDTNMGLQYQDYKIDTDEWFNHEASEYLRFKTKII